MTNFKSFISKLFSFIPDKQYLSILYFLKLKKRINWKNPKTFNEKLQWLKLYDRKPEYTVMVDKYLAKKYVADKIGDEYIIPTLGVWDSAEEIDFDSLPEQFVLKCNHNSGGLVICKDKSKLNIAETWKKLSMALKEDYYLNGREWPYKNVPRKIIAEKFMVDESGGLTDYKFFCFKKRVDCVMVCIDRHLNDTKFYFFDEHWNLKRINKRGIDAPSNFTLPKPNCMDEMFRIARVLSENLPFVRCDLYECSGHIYFGELTFFPDCGYDTNLLPQTDKYFGDLIEF